MGRAHGHVLLYSCYLARSTRRSRCRANSQPRELFHFSVLFSKACDMLDVSHKSATTNSCNRLALIEQSPTKITDAKSDGGQLPIAALVKASKHSSTETGILLWKAQLVCGRAQLRTN